MNQTSPDDYASDRVRTNAVHFDLRWHATYIGDLLMGTLGPFGGGNAEGAGLVPGGSTPEAMAASVKQDLPRFAELVMKIGIKPE